ncbi:hypothetical protein NFI96_031469, partial [Prochilodus magdalenae]
MLTRVLLVQEVWMADAASLVKRKKRGWIVESLPLSFTLEEELDSVFPYVLGKVNVEKSLTCFLSGPGATEEPMGIFHLNDGLGVIEVNGKVDYEKNKKFTLSLECSNSETVQSRTEVEIRVLDINDNPPLFEEVSYEVSVEESTPQGTDLVTDLRVVDQDDSSTGNGLFSLSIVSVFPESPNIEFFITQQGQTGQISFRGCLDYEEAQKYIILVEAKDHGKDVQLSSMATVEVNIIDSNNHKPELSNTTGSGRVKERENGVIVYRLEVKDKDHRGSAAWRAKYTLHGDKEKNFKVETDPTTNQGIVSVVTPLDFEESPELTLQVSVENEEPLFSCQIKQRRDNSLWEVEYFRDASTSALLSFPITITVEDVNDPPELTPPVKHVTVMENTAAGQSLCTLTATDQDRDSPTGFSGGEWNQTSKAPSQTVTTCCGYDIGGYDIGGYDIGGCDIGGYDIGGCDIGGYDIGGYDIGGYDIGGYDIGGCDIGGCDFGGYDIGGCDIGGYDIGGCDIGGYDIGGCDIGGYDIGGCDIGGCDIGGCDIGGCDIGGYDIGGCDIGGYDIGGCDIGGYDIGGCDIGGCDIVFYKGEDVDHWVTVNSETGEVTTVKVLDRESPFVTDSTYTVTVYAVDRGEPPLTGTGTLVIHLLDQNDNLPQLEVNTLSMCLSDGVTRADITAVDADLPPFSGPF